MKKVLVLLPFLACGPVFAEQTADFDRTMQDVAEDLSALHWKLQAIYESQIPSGYPSSSVAAAHLLDAFKKAGIVVITADSAEIYKGAALNAGIVESVPAGKQFPVLDKVADWYAVALDEPVKGFSTGWVQAAKAVPYWDISMAQAATSRTEVGVSRSMTERLYSQIAASVNDVRLKYDTNPYVGISGFSVDMSLPPGVSILFQFK